MLWIWFSNTCLHSSQMTSANQNLFFLSAVKMRIIPTVRLCLISWRWLFRLSSFYKGELNYNSLIWTFWSVIKFLLSPHTCSHSCCLYFSVSRPDKVFFPPVNWKVTKNLGVEQDVGPSVEHIYEVTNHSCADSLWLSRLGWKADLTVHKTRRLPRAAMRGEKNKETYPRLHSVIYSQAVHIHFHVGEIQQCSTFGGLFVD